MPAASNDRPHGLKYRLYYGKDGIRIVGYDNERGKGDHRLLGDQEGPYAFSTVEQLLSDFMADVHHKRGGS